jgi:hypothetical protein
MTTATATDLDELTLREVENALRLPCEMPDCLGKHEDPATWEIEVRHSFTTCEVGSLLICSKCRDGLHRLRNHEVGCPKHGPLGYSVGAWWRPLRVI